MTGLQHYFLLNEIYFPTLSFSCSFIYLLTYSFSFKPLFFFFTQVVSEHKVIFGSDLKFASKKKAYSLMCFASLHARAACRDLLTDEKGSLKFASLTLLARLTDKLLQTSYPETDLAEVYRLCTDHEKAYRRAYGKFVSKVCIHYILHFADATRYLGAPIGQSTVS